MHLEDEFPINNGTVKVKKPGKVISCIVLAKRNNYTDKRFDGILF